MADHDTHDHTGVPGVGSTVTDATISTSDVTTNNASTSKHGWLKKLSNVATEYMDGTGAWSTPAGSGGSAVVPWSIAPEGGAAAVGTRTIGAANRAIYVPCTIPAACTITGIRIPILVQSGNICVGLYDSAGSRVATSGSTACPASGQQIVSFTGGYSAAAGRYYLAIAFDNNTASFPVNDNVAAGLAGGNTSRFEASAFPLPATATMSQPISTPAIVGIVSGGHP